MKCLSVFFFHMRASTGQKPYLATSENHNQTLENTKSMLPNILENKCKNESSIHALQMGQIRAANVAMSYNLYQQMKLLEKRGIAT